MARSRVQSRSRVPDTIEAVDDPPSLSRSRTSVIEKPENSAGGAAVEWLLMLVLVGYAAWVIYFFQAEQLPMPLSADGATNWGFAEGRAYKHMKALAGFGPHPVGSKALDNAVQYVYSELIQIKDQANDYVDVEIDVFNPNPGVERLEGGLFKGKSLIYANLRQIVVRVSPSDFNEAKENSILVSSHIDSVITSSGAGDCSSCIGVMLELVRAMSHWAHGFKHSVIFLFNTGEEEGLLGAHSFITQHPWSPMLRVAIDVEAMGTGGKPLIFQAGPSKWLLELYAKVAKYPSGQVIAQDAFHFGLVKSATDYQVFLEVGGLSGLDFAHIENGAVYHTKNDKPSNIRPGSLQPIGTDLLAVLREAARSDDLPFLRTNYTRFDKMESVYFDILGRWMVTYSQATAQNLHISVITQGLILLMSSMYLSGHSAFIEFGLALVTLALTWFSAVSYVLIVSVLLPYVSPFPIPYIAHPWLVVGLFGAPAVFGALLGHSVGRGILTKYLTKNLRKSLSKDGEGVLQQHAEWHAERWLFKAGIMQWIVVLALGTWIGAGSAYIALFWTIPPAVVYGLMEAQFSPKQSLRGLQRTTLWLSMAAGVIVSAVPVIRLTAVLIGNLVRFDRNPGSVPLWTGNALTGVLVAGYACLMLVYLLPYAHRSDGLVWILVGLSVAFFATLVLIISQIYPAFSEHVGKSINVVYVIDTKVAHGNAGSPRHYISVSGTSPGTFGKEFAFLDEEKFICGQYPTDFVSHHVKYGCEKSLAEDKALSKRRPTLKIEKDKFRNEQRVTMVRFNSGSSQRWNLAINSTAVEGFKLESFSVEKGRKGDILVPGGHITGVDGWHNVQYVSGANGPNDFQLTLFWHPSFKEEASGKWGSDTLILKLRTDVDLKTTQVDRVLRKMPNWCVLFGKSTSPYLLAYLAELKVH